MASVTYIGAVKLAELLQKADAGAGLVVSVVSASRLALGKDPLHPSITIDFSKEAIGPYEPDKLKIKEAVGLASASARVWALRHQNVSPLWIPLVRASRRTIRVRLAS